MVATSSDARGDVGRYVDGRERVLGRRCTITEDDDATAQVLAEFYGGPRRACAALRRILAQLDSWERRS